MANFTKFNTLGKDKDASPEKGLAHNVVLDLVQDLLGKGYYLFMDNFYTSPELFLDLLSKGFHACGTVRMNRKDLSNDFRTRELSKGKK